MNTPTTLVDARSLVDPKSGGVKRVAMRVLSALVEQTDTSFAFVTTGTRVPELPEPFRSHPRVQHVHIKWPNKLWSLLANLGVVSLDVIAARKLRAQGTGHRAQAETPRPAPQHGAQRPIFQNAILPNLGFIGFLNIPYALILHDLSFIIHPPWFNLKTQLWHHAVNPKELARRADRIFAVSETTARDAVRLLDIPAEKIEVFHPGAPTLGLRAAGCGQVNLSARCPMPDAPYVLAFGPSDPRKNTSTAIKAVELLRQDPNFANLSIVLIDPHKPANQRTSEPNWIIYRSAITDSELANLYEHASALLYPSWYEGFGLPLHEAARFGIPCIASSHGALPETAPAGTVFVPPMKPQLWAQQLHDILQAPQAFRTSYNPALDAPQVDGFVRWMRDVISI